MKSKMLLSMALATVSLVFASGCSTDAKKKSQAVKTAQAERQAAALSSQIGGTQYTTVEFEKGRTRLTPLSKKHLNELAAKAKRDSREIDEIKILAWADKEYPDRGSKATTAEVILAKERAESIRNYLEKDLHSDEEIDTFNMAKRPGLMSKLVYGEDYQVKEKVEQAGATKTIRDDGSVSYSKASKAMVIIDYEGDENKR